MAFQALARLSTATLPKDCTNMDCRHEGATFCAAKKPGCKAKLAAAYEDEQGEPM